MKLRRCFVSAAMALECAAVLNAQQSFVEASVSSIVSCVSKGKERQQCSADTRAGIVMLRPTGEAACLLGRNWGYDDQGVWVSEGCGGDFATGSTSRAAAPAPSPAPAPTAAALVQSEDEKSQMATTTTGINPTVDYTGGFQPYGSLRTIISIPANGPAEVQDDATRVGINFTTFGPVKVIGTTEWGVNLVQSETSLNVGATTASGFGEVQHSDSTRLRRSPWFCWCRSRQIWASLLWQAAFHPLRHSELHDGSLQRLRRSVYRHLCCRH